MSVHRRPAVRRRLLFLLIAILVTGGACGSYTLAQTTIEPPPPRFVSPDDFVTLVFVIHSSITGSAAVQFTAPAGWTALGDQSTVALAAGRSIPLAVTVTVPPGGEPNASRVVTLELKVDGTTIRSSADLHVLPQPSIALSVPGQVSIDAGEVPVTIKNTGNIALRLAVSFGDGTPAAAERSVDLAAQASTSLAFKVNQGGQYLVAVKAPGTATQSQSVTVLAYGVPSGPPFTVQVRTTGYLSSTGSWRLNARMQGTLSDYARLSAQASTNAPEASFAEVDGDTWSVRLGAGANSLLNLSLPVHLGVAAEYDGASWSAFVAGGSLQGDQWAGYAGGGWIDAANHVLISGAAGMASGRSVAAISAEQNLPDKQLGFRAQWRDGLLDTTAHATVYLGPASLQVRAHAGSLTAGTPSADVYVGYVADQASLTAAGRVNLLTSKPDAGSISLAVPLPTPGLTNLSVDAKLGLDTSFVRLQQQARSGAWTTTNSAGLVWDQYGRSAAVQTSWTLSGTDYIGIDGALRVGLDDGAVRGSLGARTQGMVGPVLLFGGVRADGTSQTASARAGAQWQSGNFSADLTADMGTTYLDPGSNLAATVTLHATYTFPVAVPSGLSELAGGRREGVLAGRVEGAPGLTSLVVLIGPYRVRVGADGSFHARLRPGEYRVRLDPRSVPVTYVIEQPAEATVHVAAKATTHVVLALAKGAGVSGHVLLDTNGDGTPDSPRHGVVATIALLDAAGALHSTSTDAEGVFLFRNVTPGAASLTISGLPLGDAAENGPHHTVDVTAGTTSQVDILIHPVASTAKVFGGSTMRIRSVHLEADRAPPGSAPLVDVVTSAPADGVTLVTSAGSVALSGSGTHWLGRVPIPEGASPGVYTFKISARKGTKAEERRGQLIVDPGVPLLTAAIDKKGVPGGTLTVNATLLTEATHVEVTGADSIGIAGGLKSMGGGAWSADLPVPEGLASGRYTLTITAYGRGGVLGSTTATAVIAP